MSENTYKDRPGDSWKERRQAEAEDEFTTAAANFALSGGSWDLFVERYPAYKYMPNTETLKDKYNVMREHVAADRYTGKQTFSVQAEIDKVREARSRRIRVQVAENRYREKRDELLDAAFNRMPWSQVKRQLDMGADEEGLYKRARIEAGTDKMKDAEDPAVTGFIEGFYSV